MKIVLATLNSSYKHTAFGLRYLLANMGALAEITSIREFTIAQRPRDIAEELVALQPTVLGLGVYIWNTVETLALVSVLKKVAPEIKIVLGGPEISFETEGQKLWELADYVIPGEADFLFRELCQKIRDGALPAAKVLRGPLPEITQIQTPYALYSDADIQNRVLYVEASRGCPYKCEYCLSSLDTQVRNFPLEAFLAAMERLIQRGARQFKFVDRTFNLSLSISLRILDFFLERIERGLFLHFELVPDRLPEELRSRIERFPAGSLQFEIGIQTWNPEVSALVSRKQNLVKIQENFAFLHGKVHTHADLIAGLPGENLESFARGFDAVAKLQADEIQVGILKRLKGTPIARHEKTFALNYDDQAPFPILSTSSMTFSELQYMGRFSRFWDLYANSGNFTGLLGLFRAQEGSLFQNFSRFVEFLHERHRATHGIALLNLTESAWIYGQKIWDAKLLREVLVNDYSRVVKRDIPVFLRAAHENPRARLDANPEPMTAIPPRQRRHLAGSITKGV